MKKQSVGKGVESRGQIKMKGISLTLKTNYRGNKNKIPYQIRGDGVGLCENTLRRV
jgi:hypothetical protein